MTDKRTEMLSEIRRILIHKICAQTDPDRHMQTDEALDRFITSVQNECWSALAKRWPKEELEPILKNNMKSWVCNPEPELKMLLKHKVPVEGPFPEAYVKRWADSLRSAKVRRKDHKTASISLRDTQVKELDSLIHSGSSSSAGGRLSLDCHDRCVAFIDSIPVNAVGVRSYIDPKKDYKTYKIQISGTLYFNADDFYTGLLWEGNDRWPLADKYIRFRSSSPVLATPLGIAPEVVFENVSKGPVVVEPFMNGGTLAEMLDHLPKDCSAFRRWSNAMHGNPRRDDMRLSTELKTKMRLVYKYIPEIALALAEGVHAIHATGWAHTNLNCKRVKFHFDDSLTSVCVAIGDWKTAIRYFAKERRHKLKGSYTQQDGTINYPWWEKRVFMSPADDSNNWGSEIYDIYSLGYIYEMLFDFVNAMRHMKLCDEINPTDRYSSTLDIIRNVTMEMMMDRGHVHLTRPSAENVVDALKKEGLSSELVVRERRHMKCGDPLEMAKLLLNASKK